MSAWYDADPYFVFDTETTGLDPERHRVVELAVARYYRGDIVSAGRFLINPGSAPLAEGAGAFAVNGIDPKLVGWAGVEPAAAFHGFKGLVAGCAFGVGHNVMFDVGMLDADFRRAEIAWGDWPALLCTQAMAWGRHVGALSLVKVAKALGIKVSTAHRAAGDVATTHRVFRALAPRYPWKTLDDAVEACGQMRAEVRSYFASRHA